MLTSTFLNVLLSVVFTYFFGLLGPILGTLMTYLFYTFPKVIDMIASVFLFNKVDIYFSIIPSFVFMHIFGASGYFLVHESFLVNLNKKSDFLILLPITSLLFLLFFASGYIILLNNSDRRFVLDRFLSLKRIFKSS
jgi:hypothetical protein